MELEKAKIVFKDYVSQFDNNDTHINRKILHTYRVMKLCEKISKSLALTNEDIEIAKYIGLFHDIGRFEQITKYKTFCDLDSINHADYGVKILEEKGIVEKFTSDLETQNIIKKAIQNHNKYDISDTLSNREKLFAEIIRDADKLDILEECINIFYNNQKKVYEIEMEEMSKDVMKNFYERKLIKRKKEFNSLDELLGYVGFIFDINFSYSLHLIYTKKYIERIFDKFDFKKEKTKINIEIIKNIITRAIEEGLGHCQEENKVGYDCTG